MNKFLNKILNSFGKVVLRRSSGSNVISLVGATHMDKAVAFMERVCNLNKDKPITVHMMILKGKLPHTTRLSKSTSTLRHMIDKYMNPKHMTHGCYTPEMEGAIVYVEIKVCLIFLVFFNI